jgi:hypothetical protein
VDITVHRQIRMTGEGKGFGHLGFHGGCHRRPQSIELSCPFVRKRAGNIKPHESSRTGSAKPQTGKSRSQKAMLGCGLPPCR